MSPRTLAPTGPSPVPQGAHPRRSHRSLAREHTATYDDAPQRAAAGSGDGRPASDREDLARFTRLQTAVDEVMATDLDPLSDGEVRDRLRIVQRQLDRLSALRATATGLLESRAIAEQGPGRETRATAATRQFLTDELRLSPSEAKKAGETGRRLQESPAAAAAFNEGQLGADHAKVITDTLHHLDGPQRDQLEQELTELAARMDPVALGREARRRLARLDQEVAVRDEARRHARRYAKVSQRADGMVSINALLEGIPGEAAFTALHAFTRHESPQQPGSREQRAADALGEIFLAALRSAEAPTQHGIRPHVSVVVHLSDLARQAGAAELQWSGPITVTELRRWLVDATVTGILLDPNDVPVKVTRARSNVPAHVWKAVCARDRGCRYPGCRRPPSWCDVAHAVWDRDGGRVTLDNTLLLCREHHRKIDLGGWTITIDGLQATFTHPDRAPLISSRGDPPDT